MPDQLQRNLTIVTETVERHSHATGAQLNFDKGQTEALCVFRSSGCKRVKQALLQGQDPSIPLMLASGSTTQLRLVDTYTHLGSIVTFLASPVADVRSKLSTARLSFSRLHKTLLRNTELTAAEKLKRSARFALELRSGPYARNLRPILATLHLADFGELLSVP